MARCALNATLAAAILASWGASALTGPDLVVCRVGGTGSLTGFMNYGPMSGIRAYAAESVVCNYGSEPVEWDGDSANHPIFSQTLYQLRAGRFRQLGQAWVKHGGFAAQVDECGQVCQPAASGFIGVGCCDAYAAITNGTQFLGPKSEVNPSTGEFLYPFCHPLAGGLNCPPTSGNTVARRLQVRETDLDTSHNAQYFFQIHVLTSDEISRANPRTDGNNASYRPLQFGANLTIDSWTGPTVIAMPAIRAWKLNGLGPGVPDPDVVEAMIELDGDGRFYLAAKASLIGVGLWQYEYAVMNYNSHRGAGSFTIPLPIGHDLDAIGFSGVESHSGEPYSNDDWSVITTQRGVTWTAEPFILNPNANALRWDTLYNFHFRSSKPPAMKQVSIGLHRPPTASSPEQFVSAPLPVPDADCNQNGIADSVEIAANPGLDVNGDGIIDSCDPVCFSDITGDGQTNVNDLLAVISAWGACGFPGNCPADIAPLPLGDGQVSVSDLLAVVSGWGPCL